MGKIVLLFGVFILLPFTIHAQKYCISGVVVDEYCDPLPGASVWVKGTTIGAGSNTNGAFSIQLKSGDPITLHASYSGFEAREMQIDPKQQKEALHIQLKPAKNELHEVVVTGARVERPIKEVPVLTRIIGVKEIESVNPMSIESLLQYELPGLQIGYNSMSQMPEIKYQGMDGEYILFLIDGERISGEGSDHNVDFTRFNVDDIERIEVIRGAQSTVYGSNALGGVVNIITKNANRPFSGNLSARYAGSNGQKYSASVGTKQNRFSSMSSLTYRTKDSFTIEDQGGTDYTTIHGYNIWDAGQKFSYAFTEKFSADVKGSFYHNKRHLSEGKRYQDYFTDYVGSTKLKYLIDGKQQLSLSYTYDEYKKDKDFFKAGFVRTDYRNRNHVTHLDYSGTFGKHTLSAGGEGNYEYLKHYMMKDSADAAVKTAAFYAQEDWKMTENLNVIMGVRADYQEKYKWHLTPKISAMYRPINSINLRAGYCQGFRSPSLKELYQEYDMGGLGWFMLYGNPNLKPETSNQFSASAEWNRNGWNASVSAYHNLFRDKIVYKLLANGSNDMQYVNADQAKATGVEAILRWRSDFGLTLMGSYAYVNDYQNVEGKNTSSVRPHSLTFNAQYATKIGKIHYTAALHGQWASRLATHVNTSSGLKEISYDPRTLCNLNVSARFPRGILFGLGVDNLFNYKDKAADSSLQLPQKGISGVATLSLNMADLFKL
ncbi:MAG: TonB-dependent receptor [Candidatus Limimorpha sp.]